MRIYRGMTMDEALGAPLGVDKILTGARNALYTAAGGTMYFPPGAAVATRGDDRPWYARPITWIVGGGLLVGAYFLMRPKKAR